MMLLRTGMTYWNSLRSENVSGGNPSKRVIPGAILLVSLLATAATTIVSQATDLQELGELERKLELQSDHALRCQSWNDIEQIEGVSHLNQSDSRVVVDLFLRSTGTTKLIALQVLMRGRPGLATAACLQTAMSTRMVDESLIPGDAKFLLGTPISRIRRLSATDDNLRAFSVFLSNEVGGDDFSVLLAIIEHCPLEFLDSWLLAASRESVIVRVENEAAVVDRLMRDDVPDKLQTSAQAALREYVSVAGYPRVVFLTHLPLGTSREDLEAIVLGILNDDSIPEPYATVSLFPYRDMIVNLKPQAKSTLVESRLKRVVEHTTNGLKQPPPKK